MFRSAGISSLSLPGPKAIDLPWRLRCFSHKGKINCLGRGSGRHNFFLLDFHIYPEYFHVAQFPVNPLVAGNMQRFDHLFFNSQYLCGNNVCFQPFHIHAPVAFVQVVLRRLLPKIFANWKENYATVSSKPAKLGMIKSALVFSPVVMTAFPSLVR